MKIPENILNDFQFNLKNYNVLHKVISENEDANEDDYKAFIYNKSTKEKFPIQNKYSVSDKDYNSILDLVINRMQINKSECLSKVKNKRDLLSIELFDLNSDGLDEYIIWCDNSKCFVYNHAMDVFILEKRGNEFVILFSGGAEILNILNQIYGGYYIIEESGIAGRGQKNPDEVITTYKFNGKEYKESNHYTRKVYLDGEESDDSEFGDG